MLHGGSNCTEEFYYDSLLLPGFRYAWDNSRALVHNSLQRRTDKIWAVFKTSDILPIHQPQDCRGVSLSIPWHIRFSLNLKWTRKYVLIIFPLSLKVRVHLQYHVFLMPAPRTLTCSPTPIKSIFLLSTHGIDILTKEIISRVMPNKFGIGPQGDRHIALVDVHFQNRVAN